MPKKVICTDEQLVDKIISKDNSAYTILYKRYNKKIKSYYYKQKVDFEVSCDLTVDVLCKAFDSINNFDKSKAKFNNWIGTIARNTLIDHRRYINKKRQLITVAMDETFDSIDSSNDSDTDFIKRDILENLKNTFKQDDIDLFKLKYIDGYRYDELTKISNRPVSSLKSRFKEINDEIRK
jgi:RNA polymerase sigma-70 factor (ECF subfamily)